MVTYGPWNDGREFTQRFRVFRGGPFGDESMYAETTISPVVLDPYDGEPYSTDGAGGLMPWRSGGGSGFGSEGRTAVPSVGYEEPGYNTPIPSEEAWANMLADGGGNNTDRPILEYWGRIEPTLPTGFSHFEQWRGRSYEFGVEYYVRSGGTNWNALAGVPNEMPEGAWYAEFEDIWSSTISQALSLDVEFSIGGDPRWHLFAEDAQAAGDRQEVAVTPGFHMDDIYVLEDTATLFQTPGGIDLGNSGTHSFPLAAAAINQWKSEDGASGANTFTHPTRLPKVNVVWTGGWPGDYVGGVIDYSPPSPEITFVFRWRTARWRWVYGDVVEDPYLAPRRVYPRDDGLVGGGAPRVWPSSRAIQSSRRLPGPGSIT